MQEKTKALVEQLNQLRAKYDEAHQPPQLKEFIERISRTSEKPFSYNNLLLAFVQTQGKAVELHSIKTWNKLGKKVKKGAHGVKILFPRTFEKTNENGEKVKIRYYSVGYIFKSEDVEPMPPRKVA